MWKLNCFNGAFFQEFSTVYIILTDACHDSTSAAIVCVICTFLSEFGKDQLVHFLIFIKLATVFSSFKSVGFKDRKL